MAQDNESSAYKYGSGNASITNWSKHFIQTWVRKCFDEELEQAVYTNMGPEMLR